MLSTVGIVILHTLMGSFLGGPTKGLYSEHIADEPSNGRMGQATGWTALVQFGDELIEQ